MAYTPRYRFAWHNELNQLCEISLDAKDGAGAVYTGNLYISHLSDTVLGIYTAFITGIPLEISAIQDGETVTIGTDHFVIASYTYDAGTGIYQLTMTTGGVTGVTSGLTDIIIGPVGSTGALEEISNIVTCDINCNSDSGELFDSIITRELAWSVLLPVSSSITFDTFLFSNHDDWKVTMLVDGIPVFHGWLVPDEATRPFQDYPIEVNFKATDGLKLLSKQSLLKQDGTEFNNKHNLIDYIAACLFATGLNLPIRSYCNIYYEGMVDRADNIMYEMLQQAYLDYRTFMTSSTVFTNCYDALQIILKDHFRLYYEEGRWVIYRIPEAQYLPEGNRYYTDYQYTASIIGGAINADDYAKVGKNNIVRPINENQLHSGKFANKSVQHTFKYNIWDEIPRNNKFERAVLDPLAPNTATEKFYTVNNWLFGHENTPTGLPNSAAVTSAKAWRKSTLNAFGVETDREILLQANLVDGSFSKMFRSDPIPVNQNDKIQLSFQVRLTTTVPSGGAGSTVIVARVYIITGGTKYFLSSNASTNLKAKWVTTFGAVQADYVAIDSAEYTQVDVTSDTIPANGELYIHLVAQSADGNEVYFKDFNLAYTPYVAGGYIPVKGDYWTRQQNKNFPDTYSTEVQTSDSPIGAGKGTLFFFNGLYPKTTTNWHRYGVTESKHYKELVNLGVYNLSYRRFWKIEGEFDGTTYSNNNDLAQHPISFTPRYGFEDLPQLRLFMMVAPLKIDYIKGRFNTTFQEVYKTSADGTQTGDSASFKYLFE